MTSEKVGERIRDPKGRRALPLNGTRFWSQPGGRGGPPLLLGALALLLAASCSDDGSPQGADSGGHDQAVVGKDVGGPDQGAADMGTPDQAAVDQSSAADAGGPAIKTNTVAFIKALDKKLPTSSTTDKVEKFVPTDKEAAPWAEDSAMGKPGVESAYDDKGIELIINGHHAPFATEGTVGFAKQDYKVGKDTLQLFIWEMKKSASASKLYASFKDKYEKSWGLTFETVSGVKDKAIIADDSPNWRVFGYRGVYIYEITSTKGF